MSLLRGGWRRAASQLCGAGPRSSARVARLYRLALLFLWHPDLAALVELIRVVSRCWCLVSTLSKADSLVWSRRGRPAAD